MAIQVDYFLCIKDAYPGIDDSDFSLEQHETELVLNWNNPVKYGPKPTLQSLETHWLNIVKAQALLNIKELRLKGLDFCVPTPGLLDTYNTNYEAAVNCLSTVEGSSSKLLKNGMTSEAYISALGSNMGLSVQDFSAYILAKYSLDPDLSNPTAFEIEKYYLALTHGTPTSTPKSISNCLTVEEVYSTVSAFKTFCKA